MGWFGTLIGSSIGFIFGGPLGAIGGAALGHLLIDSPNRRFTRGQTFNAHEQRQAGYFVALFSIMGKIAAADGQVSVHERQLVERFIAQSGMSGRQAEYALRIFTAAAQSTHTVDELATQFYTITAGHVQYHLNFMDLLIRIAAADGILDANERQMLQTVANRLQISDNDFRLLLGRAATGQQSDSAAGDTLAAAYRTLGCTAESSDSDIRTAYRRLAAAYHPDKIISKDLPDEFTELAKRKFQDIQGAYQTIKAARGS